MPALMTNGRQRKSLADQIDRLDRVLDGLAENLNEAIATAVQEALRGVLTDLLAQPEIRQALERATVPCQPPTVAGSGLLSRGVSWFKKGAHGLAQGTCASFRHCRQMIGSMGQAVVHACRRSFQTVQTSMSAAQGRLTRIVESWGLGWWLVRQFARSLAIALVVGAVGGAISMWGMPWITAAAGSLGSLVAALTGPGKPPLSDRFRPSYP